jgi:hypothetical protein
VDLVRAELKIETRVDSHGEEDVTKTAAGMREVPLGSDVVAALKARKMRTKYKQPNQLIFPNGKGRYEDHDTMVKRKFQPLFARLEAFSAKPSLGSIATR